MTAGAVGAGATAAAAARPATAATEPMRAAARRFEAGALGALMNAAFAAAPTGGGPFGGGAAEAQWRPMLVDAYAEGWARRGGVGLADAVLREMVRMQDTAAQDGPGRGGPGA